MILKFRDYLKEDGSDRNAARHLFVRLLEHLLYRYYTPTSVLRDHRKGWDGEISSFRARLLFLVSQHGSLKPMFRDIDLASAYILALRFADRKFPKMFPRECPFALEQIVGPDIWRKLHE